MSGEIIDPPETYSIEDLRRAFHKPKSPYQFKSINTIVDRELGRIKEIHFRRSFLSSRHHFEMMKFVKLFKKKSMEVLHFNPTGNLLCGTNYKNNLIVVWDWYKGKVIWEHAMSNMYKSAQFTNTLGHLSNMIVSTSNDDLLYLTILPSGGEPIARHLYKHSYLSSFVLTPYSENEIVSIGWDDRICIKDTRVSESYFVKKKLDITRFMFDIAHHPLDPHISICEGRKCLIFDKRNLRKEIYKVGPSQKSLQMGDCAMTCCYNYSGTELLINYRTSSSFVCKNQCSNSDGEHLYWYGDVKMCELNARFMGHESEYITAMHSSYISMWDKKKEALLNFLHWQEKLYVAAIHPVMPVIAVADYHKHILILSPDDIKKSVTFDEIAKRVNYPENPRNVMEKKQKFISF